MEGNAVPRSADDKTHRYQHVSAFSYLRDNLLVHTLRFTTDRELQKSGSPLHALVWTISRLGHVRAIAQEHQFLHRSGRHFQ
jgi:hypothetical protein